MKFADIKNLIKTGLDKTTLLIQTSCTTNVSLLEDIITYLMKQQGKMIRPIITILCSYLCNYKENEIINISAALELIHNATLLHDDIIDNANIRRGQMPINCKWGNDTTVLVGDFLLAKASQIIASINNTEILKIISATTCTIAEGELLQLTNRNNINISEQTYLEIITKKTAVLFETTATIPAVLANSSAEIKNNLSSYGLHLGIAFQLINDLTDYQKDRGENIYKDLKEGFLTLPLIYLLSNGNKKEKSLIQEIINTKEPKLLRQLSEIITNSNAVAYTIELIKKEAKLAKQAILDFEGSIYKTALIDLIDYINDYTRNIKDIPKVFQNTGRQIRGETTGAYK